MRDRGLGGGGGRELRSEFVAGEVGRVGCGAEVCGVTGKNPGGQGGGRTPVAGCAGIYLSGLGDKPHGIGFGNLEGLQRAGDGGATDRGDEERSECGWVLHEEVFCNGGGVPRGGVEFQPAVALPSRGDEGERVSQAFDIADGGVCGRGDFGPEGARCGVEVF